MADPTREEVERVLRVLSTAQCDELRSCAKTNSPWRYINKRTAAVLVRHGCVTSCTGGAFTITDFGRAVAAKLRGEG